MHSVQKEKRGWPYLHENERKSDRHQWRSDSEAAGEAARLMGPLSVILLLPLNLGRVLCRRHNMQ